MSGVCLCVNTHINMFHGGKFTGQPSLSCGKRKNHRVHFSILHPSSHALYLTCLIPGDRMIERERLLLPDENQRGPAGCDPNR
jgi:hypothetical protein